jgi:hypothetical protein
MGTPLQRKTMKQKLDFIHQHLEVIDSKMATKLPHTGVADHVKSGQWSYVDDSNHDMVQWCDKYLLACKSNVL